MIQTQQSNQWIQPGSSFVPSVWTPYTQPYATYNAPKPLRIAYTGGTFDLFHSGHVSFLRKCKTLCDTLVVGLNRDEFVERYKGRRPIMNFAERETMLSACKHVDQVIINHGNEDSKPVVKRSGAKLVIHGDDWTGESYMEQMGFTEEWLSRESVTVVFVPYTSGVSTTELIERIAGTL